MTESRNLRESGAGSPQGSPQNVNLYKALNARFRAEQDAIGFGLGRRLRYRMGLLLADDPASRTLRQWIYEAFGAEGVPRRPPPLPACPECGVGAGLHADGCPLAAREGAGAPASAGTADGSGAPPGRARGRSRRRGGA